jgi:hypothetical protein
MSNELKCTVCGTAMTAAQHRERHKQLHAALDELIADYFAWEVETRPGQEKLSNTPLVELMKWSNEQQQAAIPWLRRGKEHAEAFEG